jgi:chemotaxis protein MotB
LARRKIIEDQVSHDRWLVSYADFITLLFAFFVVMYSISQVNEGKYKVLSDTFTEAFSAVGEKGIVVDNSPERNIDPFQVGDLARSNPLSVIELEAANVDRDKGKSQIERDTISDDQVEKTHELAAEFTEINDQLDGAFGDLIRDNLLTVRGNEEWLEVELKSSLLFTSGGSDLSNEALGLLADIAGILQYQDNPVRVEGFTDNEPINTLQFPSNWELSAARASSVVQLFIEEGIDPARLAAIGYGEYQPIADNTTEAGRAANRRVVLMISKTGELRPVLREVETVDELLARPPGTNITTGIRINIPGVNPVEPEVEEPVADDDLDGVETIELEGGGLLFTSEPGV